MLYIQHPGLNESSSLFRSVITPGLYYSGNDSGGNLDLYGFSELGEAIGVYRVSGKTIDFEAGSSAMVNGVPTIILADVGDNNCARPSYRINVIVEGSPAPYAVKTINFSYPDGKRRNCEAVILLPNGIIYLITKSYPKISGPTQVFQLISWLSGDPGTVCFPGPLLNAKMGIITDANYKDGQIALLGNGKAHLFNSGDWVNYRSITMPTSTQPEGICFSHDGKRLLMTSETNKTAGVLTPLYSVPIS